VPAAGEEGTGSRISVGRVASSVNGVAPVRVVTEAQSAAGFSKLGGAPTTSLSPSFFASGSTPFGTGSGPGAAGGMADEAMQLSATAAATSSISSAPTTLNTGSDDIAERGRGPDAAMVLGNDAPPGIVSVCGTVDDGGATLGDHALAEHGRGPDALGVARALLSAATVQSSPLAAAAQPSPTGHFDARRAADALRRAAVDDVGVAAHGRALLRVVQWAEGRVLCSPYPAWCDVGSVLILGADGVVRRLCHAEASDDPRVQVQEAARAAYVSRCAAALVGEGLPLNGAPALAMLPLGPDGDTGQSPQVLRVLLSALGAEGLGHSVDEDGRPWHGGRPPPAMPLLYRAWLHACRAVGEHALGPDGRPCSDESRGRRAARDVFSVAVHRQLQAGGVPVESAAAAASAWSFSLAAGTTPELKPMSHDWGRVIFNAGWPRVNIGASDSVARRWPRREQRPGDIALIDVVPLLTALAAHRGYGIAGDDPILTVAEHCYSHESALTPLGQAVQDAIRAGPQAAHAPLPMPAPASADEARSQAALAAAWAARAARGGDGPLVLGRAAPPVDADGRATAAAWSKYLDNGQFTVVEAADVASTCTCIIGSHVDIKPGPLLPTPALAAAMAEGVAATYAYVDGLAKEIVGDALAAYAAPGQRCAAKASAALAAAEAARRLVGKPRPVVQGTIPTDTMIARASFAYPDLERALGELRPDNHVFKADVKDEFYSIAYGTATRAASCVSAAAAPQDGDVTLLPRGLLMGEGDSPVAACGGPALLCHVVKVTVNATVSTMRPPAVAAAAPAPAPAAPPPGSLTMRPYVDDCLGGASRALAAVAWRVLVELAALANIKFGAGADKFVPPTTELVGLGVRVDVVSGTMSLADDKLPSYMLQACVVARALAEPGLRAGVTALSMASLAGRLAWYAHLHPPARVHLAALHAASHVVGGPAKMHAPVCEQLQVWRASWQRGGFRAQLSLRRDPRRIVVTAASDAGDNAVAAYADDGVGAWRALTLAERGCSSTEREFIGVRTGVFPLLRRLPAGSVIHALCDNGGAASGINRARARSAFGPLDAHISAILDAVDAAGVTIVASHVPRENVLVALCDRLASAPSVPAALALLRSIAGAGARMVAG